MMLLLSSLQEAPGWPVGYRLLASCYAHMGRLDEAREIVSRLRLITPVVIPVLPHRGMFPRLQALPHQSVFPLPHDPPAEPQLPFLISKSMLTDVGPVELWATRSVVQAQRQIHRALRARLHDR
jgi:hypothetical protein